MTIDRFKVMHWMNVRKLTPAQVCTLGGLRAETLAKILDGRRSYLGSDDMARLGRVLRISPEQVAFREGAGLAAVVQSAAGLHATRRAIQRAGIHFYNYYSMAAPPGRVAPVILDILCPASTLPSLNNGHLEPAITINLGPGDIYGRWGEELSPDTWQVLAANPAPADGHGPAREPWIVGDSYVEPSYCPHSYGLVTSQPARIVSYTGVSCLAGLLDEANGWTDPAFGRLVHDWSAATPTAAILDAVLRRRGYDADTAAKTSDVAADAIRGFLGGEAGRLSPEDLQALGDALGFDYRVLMPARPHQDPVGKTCLTVRGSQATVRAFESYTVASVAAAPTLPDLTGMFMLVDGTAARLDLCDHGETHYLVTGGEPTMCWRDADGEVASAALGPDGTAWVGPYVEHSWSGRGSLIKLGSGAHLGYLDQLELTGTFEPVATLRRGRRDALGWGYETVATGN
jgi:2-hydroxyethylphosphonate dioxygenase